MEKRAAIESLLHKSARHFGIDIEEEHILTVRDDVLDLLKENDPEWHRIMADTLQAWSLYDYIKKDRELKIKMPDIWETEVARLRQNYYTSHDQLTNIMRKHGVSMDHST